MRQLAILAAVSILVASLALAGEPAPAPAFTSKPVVTKAADGKVKIEFAVSRETDVAVYIEDAKGQVVRHLVAGVLGPNPPAPLKPGLAQSIEWDGKGDWGKSLPSVASGGGGFKVRVALGLGAKFDKIVATDPQYVGTVHALTVGPDGTVYALAKSGPLVHWNGDRLVAMDRDGKYLRTVSPWPTSLSKEEAEPFGTIALDGRLSPDFRGINHGNEFLRHFLGGAGLADRMANMAVTPDGKAVMWITASRITAVGASGAAVWKDPAGPRLLKAAFPPDKDGGYRLVTNGRAFLAASGDGKWVYVTGLRANMYDGKTDNPAVFRAPLPDRTPGEPFFGDPLKDGRDDSHLGRTPRGLAVDGKGHLLVADFANDRVVVVSEADGKLVGQFPVEKPDAVGVHRTTGAVYVTRLTGKGGMELVKYDGWKEPKELAKLPLLLEGNPQFPWVMALDATAQPAIVWMASDGGSLVRIEDKGAAFESKRIPTMDKWAVQGFDSLEVDRFHPDKEVYARLDGCDYGKPYVRYNEARDELSFLKYPGSIEQGTAYVPGPGGVVYGLTYGDGLIKFDHAGQRLVWEDPTPPPADGKTINPYDAADGANRARGYNQQKPYHRLYTPVSMVFTTHTLGVRGDGHFFIFEPNRVGDRPPKMLREYLPSGKRVSDTPIIWKASDNVVGPRFDPQGNIYVVEALKLPGQPGPKEFSPERNALVLDLYGSIVKFSPKGGMIDYPDNQQPNPFDGQARLDPGLRKQEALYSGVARMTYGDARKVTVTGAEWIRSAVVSQCGWVYCNCESVRFDVDEFGRVWYPDLFRFRACVMDTNGNDIAHFGGYGNQDSVGPDSPVPDEKTGRLRPPKPGEKSPLAQPEIAFAWLNGVGATDRYIYTGDIVNRRMMKLKMTYAAEETVAVP